MSRLAGPALVQVLGFSGAFHPPVAGEAGERGIEVGSERTGPGEVSHPVQPRRMRKQQARIIAEAGDDCLLW